ncbi:Ltp family lipoprotein [Arthrobacter polaris]|uniref:Ltp family lipoprotein n=1 Tax=Arthrobacter polaris TaxID=2813727 RepID=UPI001F3B7BCB|nr:Ltp family lipoprotein [Arthrobacter polaris]
MEPVVEEKEAAPAPVVEEKIPSDYKSALKSAQNYDKLMPMSKVGLFDQLTSEYGDKFTSEAAQYAVGSLGADWNANALKSAKNYQEMMAMSPEGIRDQLTSEYGDNYTAEEADYAVQNLD